VSLETGSNATDLMADKRITSRTKVYITRIGLRDWLVAADSQKAALKAWDVHRNLFAEGAARVTSDAAHVELAMRTPGLPVAAPGRISEPPELAAPVKRKGKARDKAGAKPSNVVAFPSHRRVERQPKLKLEPDRSKLDAAERELREFEREAAKARAEIEKRKRAIETELEAFEAETGRRRERLTKRVERERAAID
jgi:colicin import membrane protein